MSLTFFPPFALSSLNIIPPLVTTDSLSTYTATALPGGTQQYFPIPFNAALYWLVQCFRGGNNAVMLKSTDNGVTWTPLDNAHTPTAHVNAGGGVFFDGTHTVTFCCQLGDPTAGNSNVQMVDFNLATETWGTPYGTSSPLSVRVSGPVYKLSDGRTAVFTNNNIVSGQITGINLNWWNGS